MFQIPILNNFFGRSLNYIESSKGKFFKEFFYYALKICALIILVMGMYVILKGLIGKTGYFSNFKVMFSVFETVRSITCFIITFLINILAVVFISALLWKRADHFREKEISSILFLFTRLIRTIGECLCIVPIFAALISFFAILLAAIPYAPVESLISLTGGLSIPFINNFIGNTFSALFVQNFQDYLNSFFNGGIIGLLGGAGMSFVILFGAYSIAELFDMIFYFFLREKRDVK